MSMVCQPNTTTVYLRNKEDVAPYVNGLLPLLERDLRSIITIQAVKSEGSYVFIVTDTLWEDIQTPNFLPGRQPI